MPRSYIRISPQLIEEKEADGYTLAQIGAYVTLLCEGEKQSPRGRFKNLAVLRAHLGRSSRLLPFLLKQNDVQRLSDGRYHIVGWDPWQEGDWQVNERMRRVRAERVERNASNSADRNQSSAETVTVPSRVEALSTEALSTEHGAVTVVPRKKPNGIAELEISGEAVRVALVAEELVGHQLSAIDQMGCEAIVSEFPYLTVEAIENRMRSHCAWCDENHQRRPQTVRGFHATLRSENSHVADQGGSKTPAATGRQS